MPSAAAAVSLSSSSPLRHHLKHIDRVAPPAVLYRNILKAAARHPDPHAASYWRNHWRGRFRALVEHKADDEALETELDLARRAFRSLQRAAAGDIAQLTTTLRQAYGAIPGAQRKRLLAPLLDPAVLPPQEPLDPCHPDETSPPTYSPLLIHLLGSSRLNPTPRSEATLAMPPNFPLHGVPNNEELYGRPFLQPGRIASRRWRHFDEITGKLVPPLVVRYIGLDEGAGGKEGLVKRMKACGVDWTWYEGGEQERLLERLERGAGKGQPFRVLPAKRQPIADLDLSVPPPLQPARTPPDDSQSPFSSLSPPLSPPDQAIPDEATFNPDLAPVYRSILASVCIVTLDLSATKPPHTWVHIDFSPYATEGPALYHEATEEDRRWLVKTEGGKKKGIKRKD